MAKQGAKDTTAAATSLADAPVKAARSPLAARSPRAARSPLASLWRAREYFRPYYRRLLVMIVVALIAFSTDFTIPLLTKAEVDGPIAAADRGAGHGGAAVAAGAHQRELLIVIGVAALALGVMEVVLNLIRRWIQATAVAGMEQAMRDDLYQHLQRLEPGFHDAWQSGQLLSRATTDLSAIRRFAGFGVVFLITNFVTFVVIITLLIRLDLLLGLLTALILAPVTVLCLWFERRYAVLARLVQDQQDDLATYVEEAATGIRILKALGRGPLARDRHRELAELVFRTQVRKAKLRGTFWAGLDLIPNILIATVLLLGALAVGSGRLTTGGLVAFIALVLQLIWPIAAMGYILALGEEAATASQRVYEIFDTAPEITSPPPAPAGHNRPARAGAARLVIDHVGYRYPGAEHSLLRDVCLELEHGETVALVGATGSGKTTLLHLVARLADVTTGSIRIDGTDVRYLPLPVLRTVVGCAFEDPTLFSVSVRENVALGVSGATDERIGAALAAAQADFVAELPWGLDTRIGEQGMSLSGGQRQRLALARAILTSPEVLLLDDPLSALDVHTEARVTAALGEILADTTALVVAHRPSTVALADRVAVLHHGRIVATGTHHDLLGSSERYRYLMSAPDDTRPRRTGLEGARR